MRVVLITAVVAGLLVPTSASAFASMKCGSELVAEGATRYEVWRKCGDPQSQAQRTIFDLISYVDYSGAYVQRQVGRVVDEWIYSTGSTNFDQHLTFHDDRLVDVRSGSYGR